MLVGSRPRQVEVVGAPGAHGEAAAAPRRDAVVDMASRIARGGDVGSPVEVRRTLSEVVAALDRVAPGWDADTDDEGDGGGQSTQVIAKPVPAPSPGSVSRTYFARPGERSAAVAAGDALYSCMTPYEATPGELAFVSAGTVGVYVGRINARLAAKGQSPLSHGDYPTTRKRFERLVRLYGTAEG